MSITIQDILNLSDGYVGDQTYMSTPLNEKLAAVTEACSWMIEKSLPDTALKSVEIEYIPGIHKYRTTAFIPDMIEPSDLRRIQSKQFEAATRKATREIYEDIANESTEYAYAIERSMDGNYIVVNLTNDESPETLLTLTSVDSDNATITAIGSAVAVASSSTHGIDSVRFDISGGLAPTYSGINIELPANKNLIDYDLVGYVLIDVYLPQEMTLTSIGCTLRGTAGTTVLTTTVDATGDAFKAGLMTLAFPLSDSVSSSETLKDITEIDLYLNHATLYPVTYGILMTNLRIVNPETLTLNYVSQYVGKSSIGTKLLSFTAVTDIPFFSGSYDSYRFPVAHKAASTIFQGLRLPKEAMAELAIAKDSLVDKQKIFPSSVPKEQRGFKVKGLNFNKRK